MVLPSDSDGVESRKTFCLIYGGQKVTKYVNCDSIGRRGLRTVNDILAKAHYYRKKNVLKKET
jgi:hypothetical protein